VIIDLDLPFLEDAVTLIDSYLERLDRAITASSDPDGHGLLDQSEYIVGFGFVACQNYLTATATRSGVDKLTALGVGPYHRTGLSFARLSNAAANYWKHRSEWDRTNLSNPAVITINDIKTLGVDVPAPYVLANALYELLRPHQVRFSNLLPFITHWRDELRAARTTK
jgi:hypothetical protein